MSSNSLDDHIVRYKIIYSTTALILGLGTMIAGRYLGGLDASYVPSSHVQVTGWVLHVFGCAILFNGNNMYPSLWLMLVGLFTIAITQYRVRTNRKTKGQDKLDGQALRSKFIYSMAGLFGGLLVTIYGITFAESGTNLCPADLVPDLPFGYSFGYLCIGSVLLVAGIVIVIATRFRIRISKNPEKLSNQMNEGVWGNRT